ncbi:MAG: hypothetical protein ACI9N0_003524, partial [Ilumatobacter sp.]
MGRQPDVDDLGRPAVAYVTAIGWPHDRERQEC